MDTREAMRGVYERALGSEAEALHPKVRERYHLTSADDRLCIGRGRMHISRGTHVLPVLYPMTAQNLLFPEAGHDIPFSIQTVGFRDRTGREVLATLREFEFSRRVRRFDSLTVWDEEEHRLLDFLGTNGYFVSELHPRVEAGAFVIESGHQWIRINDRYLQLPQSLAVDVELRDRYDEVDERYHVNAVLENTLAGHIFSYRGTFTEKIESLRTIPDDLPLPSEIETLPPL